mgnify:CR=1 FL=1
MFNTFSIRNIGNIRFLHLSPTIAFLPSCDSCDSTFPHISVPQTRHIARKQEEKKAHSHAKICPTLRAPVCTRTLLRIRYAMPAHEQPVRVQPNFLNPRNHPSSPTTCTGLISRLIPGLRRHKTGVAQTTVRRCRKQIQHAVKVRNPRSPQPYVRTFPAIPAKVISWHTLFRSY